MITGYVHGLTPQYLRADAPELASRIQRVRVRAALRNALGRGPSLPSGQDGAADRPSCDLALALAHLGTDVRDDTFVLGGLGMDGTVWPIVGAAALALGVPGIRTAIVPRANAPAVRYVASPEVEVVAIDKIADALAYLDGDRTFRWTVDLAPRSDPCAVDQQYLRFSTARQAILDEIAKTHDPVVLVGPPGTGKVLATRVLHSTSSPLSPAEQRDVVVTQDAMGLAPQHLPYKPFRAPHHTVSTEAMFGTRKHPLGEVYLAQHGMLLLDELPEFNATIRRRICDSVVRPVRIVATANPCPCGWHGSVKKSCWCKPEAVEAYLARIPDGFRRVDWPPTATTQPRP